MKITLKQQGIAIKIGKEVDKIKAEFKNPASAVRKAIAEDIQATLESLAHDVQEKIVKPSTPSRSGTLRNSIRLVVKKKNATVYLIRGFTNADGRKKLKYAAFIEGGTSAHEITPKCRKVLKFMGKRVLKRKPGQWRRTVHYAPRAKAFAYKPYVRVRGIHGAYMFKRGFDFIKRNIVNYLHRKLSNKDYSRYVRRA